jgi:hypothetical protein
VRKLKPIAVPKSVAKRRCLSLLPQVAPDRTLCLLALLGHFIAVPRACARRALHRGRHVHAGLVVADWPAVSPVLVILRFQPALVVATIELIA